MLFFGLKACDTCRKALKSLDEAGIAYELIDVRADGVSDADRAAILAALGDAAINRVSTTWRGLSDAQKEKDLADLLAEFPTLMKRPVIHDGDWTVGWSKEVQAKWLGA